MILPMLLASGCFSGQATYPDDWAPPQASTASKIAAGSETMSCPKIEGRYGNGGTLAATTPPEMCQGAVSRKYRYIGDWLCETSLALNIAGVDKTSFTTIALRQPDDDTLQVLSGDDAVILKELRRSKGDFDCNPDGLVRRLNASVMSVGEEAGDESDFVKGYNAFGSAMRLLIASGGVQSLARTFTKAADGSLVMAVQRSTYGLIIGLPYGHEYSTFVTWPVVESSAHSADGVTAAPSVEPTATWLPYKSWLMARPWLIAIGDREFGIHAVDVVPGKHWIEFFTFDARLPRYGTMATLEAGHTYQLDEVPPPCDALGTEPQWRTVRVKDLVGDKVIATRDLEAMCGVGARRCESDADCSEGESCNHYPEGAFGFCIKPARH